MRAMALVNDVSLANHPQLVHAPSAAHGDPIVVGGPPTARTGMGGTAVNGATDVLSLLGMIFAIPFVVLAVGVPIALALQLLLWLGRLL